MMFDSHLHFHVIPRYSKTKTFNNNQWKDKSWPYPHDLIAKEVDDDTLFLIKEELRNNIVKYSGQ